MVRDGVPGPLSAGSSRKDYLNLFCADLTNWQLPFYYETGADGRNRIVRAIGSYPSSMKRGRRMVGGNADHRLVGTNCPLNSQLCGP